MKILIVFLCMVTLQIMPMDKIIKKAGSHLPKDEKKEKDEKEKPKTPRDDKQKHAPDTLKESTRFTERRASDTPAIQEVKSRETKSASPLKGNSPARPNTVGKRGSLDWTSALHMDDSIKKWGERDAIEERLKKLFEEFSSADLKRQQEIYCIIMRTSVVSATKEAMASNFFDLNHKMALLALYNIPGYYSTNHEEARLEIKTFYKALFDAKEAYVNRLTAEAPKRDKWACEQMALNHQNSPIFQLKAQLEALKEKYPQHSKDFEPEVFALPELKKP